MHHCAVRDNKIYIVGGNDPSSIRYDRVLYASIQLDGRIDSNGWQYTTPLPDGRANAPVIVYENWIYVLDGSANQPGLIERDTVWYASFNPNGTIGSWTNTTNTPYRGCEEAVQWNGRIYIMGGWDGYSQHADVYFSEINKTTGELGTWNSTTSLPMAIAHGHATAVHNGIIYCIGGNDRYNNYFDDLNYAIINETSGEVGNWISATSLPIALSSHYAVVYSDDLFIVGGATQSDYLDVIFKAHMNPDGSLGNWEEQDPLPQPLAQTCSVVLPSGLMYVIGGTLEGGIISDDVLMKDLSFAWTKYFGNPLNLGTNVGGPMVILDGTMYKMWYCSGGDICYATSYDGVSWHNHGRVLNGSDNSWGPVLSRASVVLDEGTYEMWYTGYSPSEQLGRIGYANSSDGISWTKYEGNPVLTPGGNGGWDDWNVFSPTVVKDGSTYKMWYVAQDSQYSPLRIGYANSSDGISWTKYEGNPVLTPGGNGGWDDTHVSQPFIMKDGDRYNMWYVGSLPDSAKIGLATSNDGVSWTKYAGNPLLTTGDEGSWESRSVVLGSIVFDGITYKMWYEGQTGIESRIGLAYYPATLSSYDPIDDLYYYESGSHAPTWPVIDIVYTEVSLVNDTHIRLLTRTSESIPSSNQWQGYYWLLDTGVATRPYWNPHDSNDLNVSYTVGVCWGADGSLHVTVGNNTDGTTVFYEDARDHPEKYFNNDTCFITIPLSWIGDPESIRWVAGSTDGVSGGRHDKAPNMTKVGDLGGGVPPAFFDYDGSVDGKDLALFLQCYRGTAPAEAMYLGDLGGGVPPQFYDCDGNVDGKDLSLFLQCYKGLGP
jgi:N-acetylneuraminic acid mutarotase